VICIALSIYDALGSLIVHLDQHALMKNQNITTVEVFTDLYNSVDVVAQ
jgi:hypothetical protein